MTANVHRRIIAGALLSLAGALGGCSRMSGPKVERTWVDLIARLTDVERAARLDTEPGQLITSYDPTGGNDDFNRYVRKGPPGWIVLADLKGPGYVSRFWLTGGESSQRVRFYFDGEKEPRLDMTVGEFCGGRDPFLPPLAQYENYCWYSYVPIPYRRGLVIMTQEGGTKPDGWPRIFYQINYSTLPRGETVASYPRDLPEEARAALGAVREAWGHPWPTPSGVTPSLEMELAPRATGSELVLGGPGIIRELSIQPNLSAIASPVAREALLRQVILQIAWDGSAEPSVAVPLGDFFGSFWRRTRYHSMFFGMEGDAFRCRFPMPYATSAVIRLQNQSELPLSVSVKAIVAPVPAWDERWGYFHAAWQKTTPRDIGRPHPILRARGRGKYLGCVLSAASLDKSWWILEGDESIRLDGEEKPSYLGTGLEDYFNGGWYYQNVKARPLNGIVFKAPFRAVQYRLHQPDPVHFSESIDMVFERGPDNASQGWMESVAYYYLDRPARAASNLGAPAQRGPPADPMSPATLMTELCNVERFGDVRGASERISEFLEQFKGFPFEAVLRLRQVAYRRKRDGFAAVRAGYEAFLGEDAPSAAREQAETLLWFEEDPSRALLFAFCNMRAEIFLDGEKVGEAGAPDKMLCYRVELAPGRHVLALRADFKPYPDWVQLCLRTHHGDVMTTPQWKAAVDPNGDWKSLDFDDSAWKEVGGTGVKGPPEVPYVWVEPNAFVETQSAAIGLRFASERQPVVFRTTFEIP
ncbi:MAG: DUF2961 domain-containing protein [Kiritimatiellae bacterium]|nr:DUF2961 domain-containing protein [Kiritimatiellia bacterium]